MGTKTKNWSESMDRFDGSDPQIPESLFVSFCDETHGHSESSDEVEAPETNQSELMAAMRTIFHDVLKKEECFILTQRLLGDTYQTIADLSWPRL